MYKRQTSNPFPNHSEIPFFNQPANPVQTTDTVLMVSPDDFSFNPETAVSNAFQNHVTVDSLKGNPALKEFNLMVKSLKNQGIRVIRTASRRDIKTPDAVFPNNWFSLHKTAGHEKILVLYPMLTPNRRAERRIDHLLSKFEEHGIVISKIINLTHYERENKILEGTGSMVLDRKNRIAYACISPRTHPDVFQEFCSKLNYTPVMFNSRDTNNSLIYHTNVMMSVGSSFAVFCTPSVEDTDEKKRVLKHLTDAGKAVIEISMEQVNHMCGNILELKDNWGNNIIVMSRQAFDNFSREQKKDMQKFGKLLPVTLDTIEKIGGGSARCMIAEIF